MTDLVASATVKAEAMILKGSLILHIVEEYLILGRSPTEACEKAERLKISASV